ncbi:MAG: DMT family transporter [Bryobacteraceae bacterium]
MNRSWRAEVALGVVALLWGTTFVIMKDALREVSVLLFLALRFTLATVALAVYFRGRTSGVSNPRSEWRGGVLSGLFLAAGYALQTFGLTLTTPSKSAFITGLYILLVPLLAALVYRRKPHISEWIAVVVGVSGVALLTLPDLKFHVGAGDLMTVGCAVAFAAQILVVEKYSRQGSFERLALIQIGTVAVCALATFWWVEKPFITWSKEVIATLLITGLGATALAFAVQMWAQARTTATRAALIFALEPAFAGVTSVLAGADRVTIALAGGCGLIFAAIGIAELKPIRFDQHPLG